MRSEVQPHDDIRARLEVVSAGAGITGLSPTVLIKRISDGMWWDDGANDWTVGVPTAATMVAVDATNLPGVYQYIIDPAELDYDLGVDGYLMRIREVTNVILEHAFVIPRRRVLLEEPWADFTGDATLLGHLIAVGLNNAGQYLHRMVAGTYDVDGRLLTFSLKAYPTAADAIADTNVIETANYQCDYNITTGLLERLKRV